MIHAGHCICGSTVTVLGLTFKENCPDLRNSKVVNIIHELEEYGVNVQVHDALADPAESLHEYGIPLFKLEELKPAAAVISAVAHKIYLQWSVAELMSLMGDKPVLIDVKGTFDSVALHDAGVRVWRL
jgi:UDP-N-acetyl-D-galactosamine dehydrogenase